MAWRESLRHAEPSQLRCAQQTPLFVTCGDIFPRSGGSLSSQGELLGIFRSARINLPLSGEVASRSDDGEGLLPLGGAVAQRLRGFKSAEPEKTVKRSSRRTGVNLQFFPVEPTALGLKGACSPFFVDPARRNRWHFSGSLLVSKENIPRLHPHSPAERPCPLAASGNLPRGAPHPYPFFICSACSFPCST